MIRPGDVFYEPEGERTARFDAQDDGVSPHCHHASLEQSVFLSFP
jgi:hypothetical protein